MPFRRTWLFAMLLLLPACVPGQAPPGQARAPAGPCGRPFTFANQSSQTVQQLFFTPSRINAWGNDQLGQYVVAPGGRVNFNGALAEAYDFQVVLANGRRYQLRFVEICNTPLIRFNDGGLISG